MYIIRLMEDHVLVMTSYSQDGLSMPPQNRYENLVSYLTKTFKLYMFLYYGQEINVYPF